MMDGVEAFQREISSKNYPYMKPGLETMPWGTFEAGVIDLLVILYASASGSSNLLCNNPARPVTSSAAQAPLGSLVSSRHKAPLHLLWSERHLYDVPEQERRTGVGEITQLVSRYQPQYIEMVDNILDMKYFR